MPWGRRGTNGTQGLRGFGRPPRVMGVDVARGVAVVGMIAAHAGNPPELVWSDPATWAGLAHGRSSLLFALVAGVSVALMTRNLDLSDAAEVRRVRLTLVGRGVAVFLIGLVLEALGTPVAIILCVYGALFVAVAPFVGWSRRRLLLMSGALALVGPLVVATLAANSRYGGNGATFAFFSTYSMPVWLALMFAGMAVGRSRLSSLAVAARMLAIGLILAIAGPLAGMLGTPDTGLGPTSLSSSASASGTSSSELASGSSSFTKPETLPGEDVDLSGLTCERYPGPGSFVSCYDSSAAPPDDPSVAYPDEPSTWETIRVAVLADDAHSGGIPEVVGSGGVALMILALCLLASRFMRLLLIPVAALGSMPLTTYALHIVILAIVGDSVDRGVTYWAAQVVGLAVFSTLSVALFGSGPLERLVARTARWFAVPGPAPAPVPAGPAQQVSPDPSPPTTPVPAP